MESEYFPETLKSNNQVLQSRTDKVKIGEKAKTCESKNPQKNVGFGACRVSKHLLLACHTCHEMIICHNNVDIHSEAVFCPDRQWNGKIFNHTNFNICTNFMC